MSRPASVLRQPGVGYSAPFLSLNLSQNSPLPGLNS